MRVASWKPSEESASGEPVSNAAGGKKIRAEREMSTGSNVEAPVHLNEKSFCKIG